MKIIYLFLLLIISSCTICDVEKSQEQVWLDYLCSEVCMGRQAATEGSKIASKYLMSEIEKLGYSAIPQDFKYNNEVLRNIIVPITGQSDTTIVIGAHYDGQHESYNNNHFPAANDNASGVVALLSFLKNLSMDQSFPYSLNICFWDGEESILPPAFKGSDFYASSSNSEYIKLYINCDTIGYSENIYIKSSENSYNVEDILTSLSSDYSFHFLTVTEFLSDDFSFNKFSIPTIGITDGCYTFRTPPYPIHTINDTSDKISLDKIIFVSEIIHTILNKTYFY